VDPIHDVLNLFFAEWEEESSKEHQQSNDRTISTDNINHVSELPPATYIAHSKSGRAIHHRPTLTPTEPLHNLAHTPKPLVDVYKLPLSYSLVKRFFGENTYREIRLLLDGYEVLDIKGLQYWKERLEKYEHKLNDVHELMNHQLDEKRNFISFSLTIVTTVLAPMAILTGYFGMNFDNMTELNSNTYHYAPGVTLLWILCGVIYGLMLVLALHFRIIYSAT
jgi:Mg2+ and Co2+ transporter CorA